MPVCACFFCVQKHTNPERQINPPSMERMPPRESVTMMQHAIINAHVHGNTEVMSSSTTASPSASINPMHMMPASDVGFAHVENTRQLGSVPRAAPYSSNPLMATSAHPTTIAVMIAFLPRLRPATATTVKNTTP